MAITNLISDPSGLLLGEAKLVVAKWAAQTLPLAMYQVWYNRHCRLALVRADDVRYDAVFADELCHEVPVNELGLVETVLEGRITHYVKEHTLLVSALRNLEHRTAGGDS